MDVFVIRHGETEWSLSGQHTGTTDIPLTENGRRLAAQLRPILARESFAQVLTSPLQRARETCKLAGLGDQATVDPDLMEWNYGEYEGLTSEKIHESAPGWLIFEDGAPGGETPEQVGVRVDRVIARARAAQGNVVLFAHGHVLRAAPEPAGRYSPGVCIGADKRRIEGKPDPEHISTSYADAKISRCGCTCGGLPG